jgi:hypothetical protein
MQMNPVGACNDGGVDEGWLMAFATENRKKVPVHVLNIGKQMSKVILIK